MTAIKAREDALDTSHSPCSNRNSTIYFSLEAISDLSSNMKLITYALATLTIFVGLGSTTGINCEGSSNCGGNIGTLSVSAER